MITTANCLPHEPTERLSLTCGPDGTTLSLSFSWVSATLWEILYAALDKVIERAGLLRTRWEAETESTRLASLVENADADVHNIFLTVAEVRPRRAV
jgi:hypothetical protein